MSSPYTKCDTYDILGSGHKRESSPDITGKRKKKVKFDIFEDSTSDLGMKSIQESLRFLNSLETRRSNRRQL